VAFTLPGFFHVFTIEAPAPVVVDAPAEVVVDPVEASVVVVVEEEAALPEVVEDPQEVRPKPAPREMATSSTAAPVRRCIPRA
jgi:hypothetical protein